ncbi:MAG: DUF1801 domain-containing protein [Anaerolineae bacterium]|nr:DUF1801 domain-containing protein [Anaerolineae bacterium]
MVTSAAETVDAYIEEQSPQRAEILRQLRALIKETAPEANETMKYRMPTYELGDGVLCAFASQKQYVSLYFEVEMLDQYRDEFEHLSLGKSCIRFRKMEDLPLDVARTILESTVDRLKASQFGETSKE